MPSKTPNKAIRAAALDNPFQITKFFPFRLTVMSNLLTQRVADVYAGRFGLSAYEWRVIGLLAEAGPIPSADVIAQVAMDKVRVSQTVAKLLKLEYITRDSDPLDRRRAVLSLTPQGVAIYDQIVPLVREAEIELMHGLSPRERSSLEAIVTKLEVHIRKLRRFTRRSDASAS